jgi:hypothetical protein
MKMLFALIFSDAKRDAAALASENANESAKMHLF